MVLKYKIRNSLRSWAIVRVAMSLGQSQLAILSVVGSSGWTVCYSNIKSHFSKMDFM